MLGQIVLSATAETSFEPSQVRTLVIELKRDGNLPDPGAPGPDAGAACRESETKACGCGGGPVGLSTCRAGLWSACVATCAETGLIGNCGAGMRTCDETQASPAWAACTIAPAARDSCAAGADENCNGIKNEGCPCTLGAKRSCADGGFFGTCAAGTQTCTGDGAWDQCTVAKKPQDTCAPGNDDSCNGAKNEGCECVTSTTRTCASGGLSGRCAAGMQTCSAQGRWEACSIAPLAKDGCTEGDDDNCNGRPNEGCPCVNGMTRSCGAGGLSGKCAAGTQACAGSRWGACSILPQAKDSCVEGNDDNCNGRPNEGCPCFSGNVRTCGSGGAQGRCAFGMQVCSKQGQWSSCSINPAGADSCAAKDNDDNCNGIKAEGCVCVPRSLVCNGSKLEQCSDDGKSMTSKECGQRICDEALGTCRGICNPTSRRCNSKVAELCSAEGTWNTDRVCDDCVNDVCRDCDFEGQKTCWDDQNASFNVGGYSFKKCVPEGPHLLWSPAQDCRAICDPDPQASCF